jgi:hypothetical protein
MLAWLLYQRLTSPTESKRQRIKKKTGFYGNSELLHSTTNVSDPHTTRLHGDYCKNDSKGTSRVRTPWFSSFCRQFLANMRNKSRRRTFLCPHTRKTRRWKGCRPNDKPALYSHNRSSKLLVICRPLRPIRHSYAPFHRNAWSDCTTGKSVLSAYMLTSRSQTTDFDRIGLWHGKTPDRSLEVFEWIKI